MDNTQEDVVKKAALEIERRMRKCLFGMDEIERVSGDHSREFLWHKSKYETLESVLYLLDPKNNMLSD